MSGHVKHSEGTIRPQSVNNNVLTNQHNKKCFWKELPTLPLKWRRTVNNTKMSRQWCTANLELEVYFNFVRRLIDLKLSHKHSPYRRTQVHSTTGTIKHTTHTHIEWVNRHYRCQSILREDYVTLRCAVTQSNKHIPTRTLPVTMCLWTDMIKQIKTDSICARWNKQQLKLAWNITQKQFILIIHLLNYLLG